jgi:hypothetical protein
MGPNCKRFSASGCESLSARHAAAVSEQIAPKLKPSPADRLQIFCLLPLFVSLTAATSASSILNVQTLLTTTPNVTIAGSGAIELDFGSAASAHRSFTRISIFTLPHLSLSFITSPINIVFQELIRQPG